MAYTCFISHNTHPDERVVVYRLQTLAAASGISILLPSREGRLLTSETKQRIERADSVLVFLTSNLTASVREELAYAQALKKLIIPILERGVKVSGLKDLGWIEYDPDRETPGDVERKVIGLLRGRRQEKENGAVALIALLGIGLLALLATKKSA